MPVKVAAISPNIPAQLYGRYEIRMRADSLLAGYKAAYLLWPASSVWPRDGEIDFPIGDFNQTVNAVMHRQGATTGSDQDVFATNNTYGSWHTYVIEWTENRLEYFIDGISIGRVTNRIPNTPMNWIIKNETSTSGIVPSQDTNGVIEIDYVRVWQPVSTASCAATFTGSGGDDSSALEAFLTAHAHQNVCFNGTIRLASDCRVTIPAGPETIWNWLPGAKILGTDPDPEHHGEVGLLRLVNCFDLTINSPEIQGTGYFWEGVGTSNGFAEGESGIDIMSGGRITINDPYIHDTRGDGIYVGVGYGSVGYAQDIVINRPNMLRNSRNNITMNTGHVTINGPGTLDRAGLDNIDVEPNADADAAAVWLKVSGLRMTNHDNLDTHDPGFGHLTGVALGGCGHNGAARQLIDIRNSSSDSFTIQLQNVSTVNLDISSDTVVSGPAGDRVFEWQIGTLNLIRATNITFVHYPPC